ncbi:hypothetical protein [Catenovulum sediminis]|uniref:Uncharacterized protein n=1 Tax=Catenovulum sediminis TaxID=1740262 RepID=A0ABV1RNW8_9ALTE
MTYTNTQKNNFKFNKYAFDCSLNSQSVAIYENDKGSIVCRVEIDGEPSEKHYEQHLSASKCPDGAEWELTEMFVSNEDDYTYNKARALSEVIEGLEKVLD